MGGSGQIRPARLDRPRRESYNKQIKGKGALRRLFQEKAEQIEERDALNNKEIVVTHAGLAALEAELEDLKTVKRKEVAEKIKVARGFGDLSENSEYDEAKNEQGFIESRIAQLEAMLKRVRVLDEDEISADTIMMGSVVKVQDEEGVVEEYTITGSTEADPLHGKLSDESPVGAALLGKHAGDVADITLPNGATIQYRVLQVGRSM